MTESSLIQWEVEAILSDRKTRGKTFYEIKWVDYEQTTFEQLHNLNNCHDTLQEYLREKSLTKTLTHDNLLALDRNWVQPRVELVLGTRIVNNIQEYQVKWFGHQELSWEPITKLEQYLDLVYDYISICINNLSQEALNEYDFLVMDYEAEEVLLDGNEGQNENIQLELHLDTNDNNFLSFEANVTEQTHINVLQLINTLTEEENVEVETNLDLYINHDVLIESNVQIEANQNNFFIFNAHFETNMEEETNLDVFQLNVLSNEDNIEVQENLNLFQMILDQANASVDDLLLITSEEMDEIINSIEFD